MAKENTNQYPGCYRDKRVYVKTSDGEITRGTLVEIQRYETHILLIVEISTGVNRMVVFGNVTFIEEL